MKKAIAGMLIAMLTVSTSPVSIEAEAPTNSVINPKTSDLVYRGTGETARQVSETELTREEADVLDAQNGTGRWEVEYEPTPDHVDEEKVDDEISEHFDLFCDVVYAEAGSQSDLCMRRVADVIINRMRSGTAFDDTLKGVLTAPYQFSCIKDGHARAFKGHEKEHVRKLIQEELAKTGDKTIYYFRTDYYTPYGADAYKVDDVYFSRRTA